MTGERGIAMQRIMMIAPHFPEYSYLLARALSDYADIGLVIDRRALDADYAGRNRPAAPNVTLYPNRLETLGGLCRLMIDIIRFRPHIIHWQEPSGFRKALIASVIMTLVRPFAITGLTIHDPVPHDGRDAAIARRLARLRAYIRRKVNHIFVHGPSCREQYLNDYLPPPHRDARVHLTEHGAILAGDDPQAPPRENFSMLMFGRMEAYKGLDILLEAMQLFRKAGQTGSLTLAGAGPELDRLQESFEAIPGVRVINRYLPAAELTDAIAAADCVIVPYTSATQSGVLAAAFANGRFVIASRVGGLVDLVEHGVNGLLVEPNDPDALAAAMRRVASDSAWRERLRHGALMTARDKLNWSRIAADMIAAYGIETTRPAQEEPDGVF